MIRQTFIDHHFTAYQIIVGFIGIAVCIHILFAFTPAASAGYGAATVASFLLGNGVVALIQRTLRRKSGRMLD